MSKKKESIKISITQLAKWILFLTISILLIIFLYNFKSRKAFLDQKNSVNTPTPVPTLEIQILDSQVQGLTQRQYEELAINNLSEKLNISKDKIRIVKSNPQEYSDTSLGCPARNQMYAQIITPGFAIELEVLGQNYNYNAGLNRIVSCKGS